jgi:hypothetical protein
MATSKTTVSTGKKANQTKSSSKAAAQAASDPAAVVEQEALQHQIRERAYYKAEQRGFVSGHELEDWYAAESEVHAESAGATKH